MTAGATTHAASRTGARLWIPLVLVGGAVTIAAELIGTHEIGIGIGTLTLLPLIWGLLLGAAVSLQRLKPFPEHTQRVASAAMQVGVLLLVTRLAFLVGENISVLLQAGPALIIQEIGNLFTIVVAMPIAVLLGMGRASIGATFSIAREGAFAMTGERYGVDSAETRGVLAMYVFGTVFGALWVGLLASILAGAGWFDPLALAMGSGVGSGSMMAAASNAVAAQFPAMQGDILALAALSNLLSSALGLYMGVYVALPLADRFYRFLTRGRADKQEADTVLPEAKVVPKKEAAPRKAASDWSLLGLTAVLMLVAVWAAGGGVSLDVLPGVGMIVAFVVVGMLAHRYLRISSLVVTMTLAMLATLPWSPIAGGVLALAEPIDFLPMTTPVLVLAGLGLGRDARVLGSVGWRIVPVGLLVLTGTFLGSVLIAQLVLGAG
ncbi:DUF3100 domain-containing protein [Zhihengliuella sp.]|uniref:DUF3100 domain-containing protein n=1 Tax=Zhihengliuella sp. TaxID=1954483 RepID=UPI002810BB41|nr:DUF3100 domain-containing protein [Zhihengliuella sp.]